MTTDARVLPLALLLSALAACGVSRPATVRTCDATSPARSAPRPTATSLTLDYRGAEAIIDALERDSLSSTELDSLLGIPGVRAMVNNVTRFFPRTGAARFRSEMKTFVRSKRAGASDDFQLSDVWLQRARTRALIGALRRDERVIVDRVLARLEEYQPDTGPRPIRVYFVAGGVSDGFVFGTDPSFYINLTRAGGDCDEVLTNVVHEAYHVLQTAAQKRSGTQLSWITDTTRSPLERLLAGTLLEGTATLVADPAGLTSDTDRMPTTRGLYRRSSDPPRLAENFAVFDTVAQGLREGTIAWPEASARGFLHSRHDEERFYFVGYEMTRAIERYCGRGCIGRLFDESPAEFFRKYIALYRMHPEIPGHFAPRTEGILMSS